MFYSFVALVDDVLLNLFSRLFLVWRNAIGFCWLVYLYFAELLLFQIFCSLFFFFKFKNNDSF